MTQIIHLLGKQGSGKTTLAMPIVAGFFNSEQFCTLVAADEFRFMHYSSRDKVLCAYPLADFIMLETNARERAPIEPGDWIIDLEDDPYGKAMLQAATLLPGEVADGPTIPLYFSQPYAPIPTVANVALLRLCKVAA